MKQAQLIIIFLAFFFNNIGNQLFSQTLADSSANFALEEILTEFNNFEELHIGFYGTTQNCQPFNVYGFKYKKSWFVIADQNKKITFLVINPPRAEKKVLLGSNFLFLGLGKTHTHSYLKLKKRRKIVKDLEIYGYYKFTYAGKKAMKGLLLLEYPDLKQGPPWPFKWLAGTAEDAAGAVESVIPEISTEVTPPPIPEITIPPVPIK